MNEWPPEDKVVVAQDPHEKLLADAATINEHTMLSDIEADDRARAIERIKEVPSFDELYLAIREIGTVTSPRSGEVYESEILIDRIENARKSLATAFSNLSETVTGVRMTPEFIKKTGAFAAVTDTHGIRTAAMRLSLPQEKAELTM